MGLDDQIPEAEQHRIADAAADTFLAAFATPP
jgi:hypothetical protein